LELSKLGGKKEGPGQKVKMYNAFMQKYGYKVHLQSPNYLAMDLPPDFDDCRIDLKVKKGPKGVLISKEQFCPQPGDDIQSKKRSRAVFGGTTDARILNEEGGLQKLKDKKEKRDPPQKKLGGMGLAKDKLPEKPKEGLIQVDLKKNNSGNTGAELNDFITGLKDGGHGALAEPTTGGPSGYTFCPPSPIGTGIFGLISKKDIASFFA